MLVHERACSKCGVVKSLDDFHRHKQGKSGRKSECRGCSSGRKRRYREENRDKIAESERHYYEKNRDKVLEQKRQHYEENRDKITEYQLHYREENREYRRAKELKYKRDHQSGSEAFRRKPKGTPWTPEEDALLLVNDGRTTYQKAIELGRTYRSTGNRLYRLRKAQSQ